MGGAGGGSASGLPKQYIIGGVVGFLFLFYVFSSFSVGGDTVSSRGKAAYTVDMHSHTTESDGDRTAEEQIQLAASLGMKSLWITDHDLVRELPRTRSLQATARTAGIEIGFGVEITVEWVKKEHHLLGYFPDKAWANTALSRPMLDLQRDVAIVKSSREKRNQNMVSWLNEVLTSSNAKYYFKDRQAGASKWKTLSVPEVAEWAAVNANLMEPTSLGRPHFSKYLASLGVNMDLVFGPRAGSGWCILAEDGKAYYDDETEGKAGVKLEALMHSSTLARREIAFNPMPIMDAIQAITAAGGRAVVAHPPTLGKSWPGKFTPTIPDLAKAGLWGIEGYSSEIDAENHLIIERLTKENGLVMTGGSDNHGSLKVYAKLGDVHRHGSDLYQALEAWARDGSSRSQRIHDLSDF